MIRPKNKWEEAKLAEENFILNLQYKILDQMSAKGITPKELAKLLVVSEERVNEFLSDQPNIIFRQLARVFYVLDICCELHVQNDTTVKTKAPTSEKPNNATEID